MYKLFGILLLFLGIIMATTLFQNRKSSDLTPYFSAIFSEKFIDFMKYKN
ncbi:MAG: hypothetical protein Q8Q37_02590 [bacterium]|nr:hypothetical protein [bacterium]